MMRRFSLEVPFRSRQASQASFYLNNNQSLAALNGFTFNEPSEYDAGSVISSLPPSSSLYRPQRRSTFDVLKGLVSGAKRASKRSSFLSGLGPPQTSAIDSKPRSLDYNPYYQTPQPRNFQEFEPPSLSAEVNGSFYDYTRQQQQLRQPTSSSSPNYQPSTMSYNYDRAYAGDGYGDDSYYNESYEDGYGGYGDDYYEHTYDNSYNQGYDDQYDQSYDYDDQSYYDDGSGQGYYNNNNNNNNNMPRNNGYRNQQQNYQNDDGYYDDGSYDQGYNQQQQQQYDDGSYDPNNSNYYDDNNNNNYYNDPNYNYNNNNNQYQGGGQNYDDGYYNQQNDYDQGYDENSYGNSQYDGSGYYDNGHQDQGYYDYDNSGQYDQGYNDYNNQDNSGYYNNNNNYYNNNYNNYNDDEGDLADDLLDTAAEGLLDYGEDEDGGEGLGDSDYQPLLEAHGQEADDSQDFDSLERGVSQGALLALAGSA